MKIEMLMKQPRFRRQRSGTPVGAHLQIVARQNQDFQDRVFPELATTSYLRGRMGFIL